MLGSLTAFALALTLNAPSPALAQLRLLDADLRAQQEDSAKQDESEESTADAAESDALDFDLLGEAKPPPVPPEDRTMKRRGRFLSLHQATGIGLVGLQLATTAVGQLNYNDKFGDSNTGRYTFSHKVLAYTTLAAFTASGALALLAPDAPPKPGRGFDRVTVHKISMFTAAAGMVAQAALGIYTARREGFENKQDFGRAHLVVGYATLAAIVTGVGVLVL